MNRKMKAEVAYDSEITLEATCVGIGVRKWDSLMEGAIKANGVKIRRMIKKQLPELYRGLELEFYNPWETSAVRTNTHLIYVHSAIEYFLRIE
jgi:hypothetical protein